MPTEITKEEEFLDISKRAQSCRVKRSGDVVKLKLRTPTTLYIFKTTPEKADMLTKRLNIDIIEL
ncbi:MAG: hypothetical protein JW776_07125 [Candidatus Lokiarchaeota archaeon]|nr:hypothetical protein [Candidatus Lokiarchaeota archaeon]